MRQPFTGKFLYFFLSGYPTVWVAISRQFPQIVFRAFRPTPYPKHAAHTSLSSPSSLVVDTGVLATSPLAVAIRYIFCRLLFFLFFLLVMLPSEIPKFPTDPQVRVSCYLETFLLHDSFPKMVSSLTILSLFLSFIFRHTSFQVERVAFLGTWCPPPGFRYSFVEVAQHSNDLLMNLLEESGLPVLFLCHFGTAFSYQFIQSSFRKKSCRYHFLHLIDNSSSVQSN